MVIACTSGPHYTGTSARLPRTGCCARSRRSGGSPAHGAGAGGVPDLGQVPEPDPGVVAPRFVPVLAVLGVQGVDRDDQAGPAAGNAQPPGAVAAGRAVPAGRGEAEPGPARRRAGPARLRWLLGSGRAQPCPTACPCSSVTVTHQVVAGFRAAAAARSRASQGSTGPSPASSPGRSARPAAVPSGTVSVTRPANPPAAPPAGPVSGAAPAPAGPSWPAVPAVPAAPGARGRES